MKALELVGTLKKKDLKFKVFFLLRLTKYYRERKRFENAYLS